MNEAQLPRGFEMNTVVPLERKNLMFLPFKFEYDVKRKALIDTRRCANAMPATFLKN